MDTSPGMTMATYTRPATLPLDDFRATLDPGTGNLDRDAIVRLNVGGERFETRVSTLTDISGSLALTHVAALVCSSSFHRHILRASAVWQIQGRP